jgi:LysM repeat protein
MDDATEPGSEEHLSEPIRCKNCDSVIPSHHEICLMCGEPSVPTEQVQDERLEEQRAPEPILGAVEAGDGDAWIQGQDPVDPAVSHTEQALAPMTGGGDIGATEQAIFQSELVERQSRAVLWMAGITFVITAVLGSLVLRSGEPVQLALVPSATPIPATATLTPSATVAGAGLQAVTETPTITPVPSATHTPQAPRTHQVNEGETLFGLAYIYNVSMDIIAELNGFSVETPIQSGQTLQIPWPTATPPLEPVEVVINGESVIADPTDCERYEIQEGDALSVIAASNSVNFELLLRVNRLTDQSIMQPGDTICIPRVVYGEVLPPTPGPSPTASATSFPSGPALLYPTDGAVIDIAEEPVVLQWLAVKDLAPAEWYMVELADLDVIDRHPWRAFTRDNAFRVPRAWRPPVDEYHSFRWRISIVRVRDQREDGGLIYTFGGEFSDDAIFTWQGTVPTATPTSTLTPTPTP